MDSSKPEETLESPPSSSSPPPTETTSLHEDNADEEDENVKQLQECSVLYLSLQDCLVESNRNWKACQQKVQALKACHERKNNKKEK
ncbi:hypothetical protein GIB67_041402 [Kingdonia uniflora]|uniref:Uncharacterized protein n=1 Tax=Kingdonia uniflora TaxID=39325 RepID=A0A7J7LRG5_9MAGN|nr:hypothetical protein GIB67_041402 [Kingdonia uniflora]